MSHLNKAQFKATIIEIEEASNIMFEKINALNIHEKTKQQLMDDFQINYIKTELEKLKNLKNHKDSSGNYYTEDFNDKVTNAYFKLNNFLATIDTYVAHNFDLKVSDYNNAIAETVALYSQTKNTIVEQALSQTNDDLLQTYILSVSKQDTFQNANELISAAKDKMKDSKTYKKRIIQNANAIFSAKKIQKKIDENTENVSDIIASETKKQNTAEIDKAIRNRVLTAILKILKTQNFIFDKSNVEECDDHAKISAIKTNGEKVNIEVHFDGKFIYKFHDYEGMSCENDIDTFEETLNNIYDIEIENKKITWSNPDKIDKQSHKIINSKKLEGNG